jgi:hypothetical protein
MLDMAAAAATYVTRSVTTARAAATVAAEQVSAGRFSNTPAA